MEKTSMDLWLLLLNGAHYFFLIALVILIAVMIVKIWRSRSLKNSAMKHHSRSHKTK